MCKCAICQFNNIWIQKRNKWPIYTPFILYWSFQGTMCGKHKVKIRVKIRVMCAMRINVKTRVFMILYIIAQRSYIKKCWLITLLKMYKYRHTVCVASDKAAEHFKSRDSWTSKMPPVVFALWYVALSIDEAPSPSHPLYSLSLSLSLFFNFGSSFIFFFFFPLSRPSKVSWHFLIETSMSSSNVMLRCQCLNSIASLPLHCANRSQSYDEKGTHILQSGNTSAFTSSFSVFIYRYICTCLCARKRRFYQRALLLSLSVVSLSFFSFFNLINNERKESQYRIRGYIR